MIKKFFSSQYIICALFLMAGGFLSLILKYELSWDFANYHYYNPWAFLNDRVHYDIGVGGMNVYFNPLIDIPLYLLIQHFNDYPSFIFFAQGVWAGALLFSFLKLLLLFFDWKKFDDKIAVLLALAIGLTGNAFFFQIGTSTNEIQVSFLVMTALYLLIKEIFFKEKASLVPFFVSGFLFGAAMGLKLTAFIYCLSSGAALLLFFRYLKNPRSQILIFILGGLTGFLLVNGFWMIKLWELFENPFFPFANTIFESKYMPINNFRDMNFVPQNWLEVLIWPFILGFRFIRLEGEMFIADYRPAVAFVVLLVFIFRIFWGKIIKKPIGAKASFAFLIVFEVLSFGLWMFVFSIVRYYIVIELIAALFIVKGIWRYKVKSFVGETLYYTFVVLMVFLLVSTPYFSDRWGKHFVGDKLTDGKFVNVEDINIPDNTLLQLYGYPLSAMIPFFAEKGKNLRAVVLEQAMYRHITPEGKSENVFAVGEWQKLRSEIINNHKGPKFVLVAFGKSSSIDIRKDPILSKYPCRFLRQNILLRRLMLCVPPEYVDFVWNKENNKKQMR